MKSIPSNAPPKREEIKKGNANQIDKRLLDKVRIKVFRYMLSSSNCHLEHLHNENYLGTEINS